MTDRDVCLAWIHNGSVRAEFMASVLNLVAISPRVGRYATFTAGPHLAAARNHLVTQFLAEGSEPWLWMIDTDIVFEPSVLKHLLTTADPVQRPVVTGLYWTTTAASLPLVPMIYNRRLNGLTGEPGAFTPAEPRGGVIRVDGCGAGCLLIHRQVLEVIRAYEKGPRWFTEITANGTLYGEDLSFCLRLDGAGIPLFADTAAIAGHVKPVVLGGPAIMDGAGRQEKPS